MTNLKRLIIVCLSLFIFNASMAQECADKTCTPARVEAPLKKQSGTVDKGANTKKACIDSFGQADLYSHAVYVGEFKGQSQYYCHFFKNKDTDETWQLAYALISQDIDPTYYCKEGKLESDGKCHIPEKCECNAGDFCKKKEGKSAGTGNGGCAPFESVLGKGKGCEVELSLEISLGGSGDGSYDWVFTGEVCEICEDPKDPECNKDNGEKCTENQNAIIGPDGKIKCEDKPVKCEKGQVKKSENGKDVCKWPESPADCPDGTKYGEVNGQGQCLKGGESGGNGEGNGEGDGKGDGEASGGNGEASGGNGEEGGGKGEGGGGSGSGGNGESSGGKGEEGNGEGDGNCAEEGILGWLCRAFGGDSQGNGKNEEIKKQEVKPDFNFNLFNLPSTCPADKSVNLSLVGTVSISYQPLCTYASSLKPIILILACLSAIAIIFGWGEND